MPKLAITWTYTHIAKHDENDMYNYLLVRFNKTYVYNKIKFTWIYQYGENYN